MAEAQDVWLSHAAPPHFPVLRNIDFILQNFREIFFFAARKIIFHCEIFL
jgi:hypothetical protein